MADCPPTHAYDAKPAAVATTISQALLGIQEGFPQTGEEKDQQALDQQFQQGITAGESRAREGMAQEKSDSLAQGPAWTPAEEETARQQALREQGEQQGAAASGGPAADAAAGAGGGGGRGTDYAEYDRREGAAGAEDPNKAQLHSEQIRADAVQATHEAWDLAGGSPELEAMDNT